MSDRQFVVMLHSSHYRGDHAADTTTPFVVPPQTTVAELVAMMGGVDWKRDKLELRPLLNPDEWKDGR